MAFRGSLQASAHPDAPNGSVLASRSLSAEPCARLQNWKKVLYRRIAEGDNHHLGPSYGHTKVPLDDLAGRLQVAQRNN